MRFQKELYKPDHPNAPPSVYCPMAYNFEILVCFVLLQLDLMVRGKTKTVIRLILTEKIGII